MLTASYTKYALNFIKPGGTSRGVLHQKDTYILSLYDSASGRTAYGEANLFSGLSSDDHPCYEEKLAEVVNRICLEKEEVLSSLKDWPSIYLGVETVLADWRNGCRKVIFDSDFVRGKKGIDINGLIWMGPKEDMLAQVKQKLEDGFTCLKLKIGAIDFASELEILKYIRSEFSSAEVELRVDANGAFSVEEAPEKLQRLSEFELHSIEQPVKAGQWEEMARVVANSPVPVALDEELIGVNDPSRKKKLIEVIAPPYIILKPALAGGFTGCDEWIRIMERAGGKWWITSALESNIGLNAIAQYTYVKNNPAPQGLGTGKLYNNNFPSPLEIEDGRLVMKMDKNWDMSNLRS